VQKDHGWAAPGTGFGISDIENAGIDLLKGTK